MMRPSRILLLLTVFALALGGCGYRAPGRSTLLPDTVRTVRIEFFANRTLEPLVENYLSQAVVERFARGRALKVVDEPEKADAILNGTIINYTTEPSAYGDNDRIVQWRSAMTATAVLRKSGDSQVLWRGTVTWTETFSAASDKAVQEENEAVAIRTMSKRMAEEFYFRLTENF